MAEVLQWEDGAGDDIHVLRRGPTSNPLSNSFKIHPNFPLAQFPLRFIPHFKGAPNAHGVKVDTKTGVVTAGAHPGANQDKLRNFLMTIRQEITSQNLTFENKIRVHVHDKVEKIWLTPATVSIHTHADECRFTVLAEFDDGTVGDISDWSQLTWKSKDGNAVKVQPGGILAAEPGRPDTEMQVEITVRLNLPTPVTDKTASAKAATRANWTSLGARTPVRFVAGPVQPDPNDLNSSKRSSVKSVVESRTNVLFVSEGFTQGQQTDFAKAVEQLVKTGLRQEILQPFKLLKDSINYWSVFLRSEESGISLLGDYQLLKKSKATEVPRPEAPEPGATLWTVENMLHEVGLPTPKDPALSVAQWVTIWNKLYASPVTAQLVASSFSDWEALRSRTPLNERDAVFGMAHRSRTRVSATPAGDALLGPAWRRTTEANIRKFIESLQFGPPSPANGFPLGETWGAGAKDEGLVCFICLSDFGAGEARLGFFTASTGLEHLASVVAAPFGQDLQTAALSDPAAPHSSDIFAALVAHECSHGFKLGDEYGPGVGAQFPVGFVPLEFPNLQEKGSPLVTGTSPVVYHPDQIKWLLPRVAKVGLVAGSPQALGAKKFRFPLRPGHGKPFVQSDPVLIRLAPLDKSDVHANLRFVVDAAAADSVEVTQRSGTPLTQLPLVPGGQYVLIGVQARAGVELKLISDKVLTHLATSGGPLNAPKNAPRTACTGSANAASTMSPTNVPQLSFRQPPAAMADVLGLYEGGGHFDCGIFRPAGRCKMRNAGDRVVPFCQVCRYLIVDRVDPMKLADLDKLYEPFYPT